MQRHSRMKSRTQTTHSRTRSHVEEAFTHAVAAVRDRDASLARSVIDGDHTIDQAEITSRKNV
jgi:hypothetical protein